MQGSFKKTEYSVFKICLTQQYVKLSVRNPRSIGQNGFFNYVFELYLVFIYLNVKFNKVSAIGK